MNDNANSFFIELSTLFDPSGFDEAQGKLTQSENSFNTYFKNLEDKSADFASIFESYSSRASANSISAFSGFFDVTSKNFLDMDNLAKQVFSSITNSALSAFSNFATNAIFGGLTGGTSFFGGLLGSRRTGGPINKTGPYYLHEGEFVLPPEIVDSIQNTPANTQTNSGENVINITLNSPITVNANQDSPLNAREICEEIASATRRGVSWAVEQAKISYKIGKQRSGEVSL
ncbi:MAG: hypothetical protein II183_00365 [Elusimicrobiaceae bacterium]|nr:hypothetical protein [Elusimicrobiaceae bacterium]